MKTAILCVFSLMLSIALWASAFVGFDLLESDSVATFFVLCILFPLALLFACLRPNVPTWAYLVAMFNCFLNAFGCLVGLLFRGGGVI